MRPVALPYLSHDRLTATNCIALEDKANTAHTYTETCMELAGYLCRKRAIPPPPLKCWIPGGRKGMPHFMLPTVTNFISQIQAHWQSAVYFNPYPTAFPYGNGMVLHFYQQQESSTTKTVHRVINKGLKTYV